MADESVSTKKTMLGEKGLAKLVSLVLKALGEGSGGDESKGDYLPLTGGSLTGNLIVNGNISMPDPSTELWVRGGTTNIYVLNVRGDATFGGDFTVDSKATFCGGTYIDTDGHIHLPSGVEIY